MKWRKKLMAIVDVTDQNFVQDTSEGLVLVDFWAPWCGPCKMIAPVLEELDDELGDKVKIVKLNVDDNQETAGKFGVMSIPTLLLMRSEEHTSELQSRGHLVCRLLLEKK